ncbi:hypothetical protein Bbelb_355260 [Branchiostoma belcheri]|nr:hypothetical protein Bbelb_355260 [Branchiostoma belcheri]
MKYETARKTSRRMERMREVGKEESVVMVYLWGRQLCGSTEKTMKVRKNYIGVGLASQAGISYTCCRRNCQLAALGLVVTLAWMPDSSQGQQSGYRNKLRQVIKMCQKDWADSGQTLDYLGAMCRECCGTCSFVVKYVVDCRDTQRSLFWNSPGLCLDNNKQMRGHRPPTGRHPQSALPRLWLNKLAVKPVRLTQPVEPGTQAEPARLTQPVEPGTQAEPARLTQPVEPGTQAEPARLTRPVEPGTQAEPARLTQPVEPGTQAEPARLTQTDSRLSGGTSEARHGGERVVKCQLRNTRPSLHLHLRNSTSCKVGKGVRKGLGTLHIAEFSRDRWVRKRACRCVSLVRVGHAFHPPVLNTRTGLSEHRSGHLVTGADDSPADPGRERAELFLLCRLRASRTCGENCVKIRAGLQGDLGGRPKETKNFPSCGNGYRRASRTPSADEISGSSRWCGYEASASGHLWLISSQVKRGTENYSTDQAVWEERVTLSVGVVMPTGMRDESGISFVPRCRHQ